MADKNLVRELTKKLAIRELESSFYSDKDIHVGGRYNRATGKTEGAIKIKQTEFDQLEGLYLFVKENQSLTQEELNELLKTKFLKFKFLRKVNAMLPDLLAEIKMHGAMQVAIYYANRVHVNKQIDRVLK